MKKFLKWTKNNILLCTVLIMIALITCHFSLGIFNMGFRLSFIYSLSIFIVIGLIVGTIQLFRKKGKIVKSVIIIICTGITIVCLLFWQIILLLLAFSYTPEHVVEKDNKKYVAHVYSWLDTDVKYYDYINFFLMGKTKRIHEYYYNVGKDVLADEANEWEPSDVIYYDENGKIIKDNSEKNNSSSIQEKENNTSNTDNKQNKDESKKEEDNVLYEKKIDESTYIRVVYLDSILAQRMLINIQKTTDGGMTWKNQLQMRDGYLTIHNGASFVFIDENIGFINDKGLAGTSGENRGLLVTRDGGKNFVSSNIIKPNTIMAESFFVDDVPYIENNILKVKVYIIEYNYGYQEKVYYDFYSEDDGLNWKIYQDNESEVII